MVATALPKDAPIGQYIHPSRVLVVVHVKYQPARWTAIVRQNRHRVAPVAASQKATDEAQLTDLCNRDGVTVAVAIRLPMSAERQRPAFISRKHHATQTNPVVAVASGVPGDLTVGLHINTSRPAVVVLIEDQALLRSAVLGKDHHWVAPMAMLDQTLDHADRPLLGVRRTTIAVPVSTPA